MRRVLQVLESTKTITPKDMKCSQRGASLSSSSLKEDFLCRQKTYYLLAKYEMLGVY